MPGSFAAGDLDGGDAGAGRLFRTPSEHAGVLTHSTRYDAAATTALLAEVAAAAQRSTSTWSRWCRFLDHSGVGTATMACTAAPGSGRLTRVG